MSNTKYIAKTTDGQEVDLTTATILKSNNLYPFGPHNYAIYVTPEGVYVKGLNNGEREIMLTSYEIMDEATAQNYRHPYTRKDEE